MDPLHEASISLLIEQQFADDGIQRKLEHLSSRISAISKDYSEKYEPLDKDGILKYSPDHLQKLKDELARATINQLQSIVNDGFKAEISGSEQALNKAVSEPESELKELMSLLRSQEIRGLMRAADGLQIAMFRAKILDGAIDFIRAVEGSPDKIEGILESDLADGRQRHKEIVAPLLHHKLQQLRGAQEKLEIIASYASPAVPQSDTELLIG